MKTVLRARDLHPPHLRAPLDAVEPYPTIEIAPGGKDQTDFWRAIDGQLKPGLEVLVSLPVDLDALSPTAPAPGEVDITTVDQREPRRVSRRVQVAGTVTGPDAVGAVVRTPRGSAIIDEQGRFVVAGQPGDELTVDTPSPRVIEVPPGGSIDIE
jgi:hypothetical protein